MQNGTLMSWSEAVSVRCEYCKSMPVDGEAYFFMVSSVTPLILMTIAGVVLAIR